MCVSIAAIRLGLLRARSAEDDSHPVGLAVISERDAPEAVEAVETHPIDLHGRHSPGHAPRVLDDDLVPRGVIAERQREAFPRARDTGVDDEARASQPEPEYAFEPGPIHPPRRPRVPCPAPPAD